MAGFETKNPWKNHIGPNIFFSNQKTERWNKNHYRQLVLPVHCKDCWLWFFPWKPLQNLSSVSAVWQWYAIYNMYILVCFSDSPAIATVNCPMHQNHLQTPGSRLYTLFTILSLFQQNKLRIWTQRVKTKNEWLYCNVRHCPVTSPSSVPSIPKAEVSTPQNLLALLDSAQRSNSIKWVTSWDFNAKPCNASAASSYHQYHQWQSMLKGKLRNAPLY